MGHKYLPWALGVQESLAGLASHHPPEDRTVEAAALRMEYTGWALRRSVGHPVCTRQHWAAPPSTRCPLSPAPSSPGPAQNMPQQVCVEEMAGR